MSSYAVYVIPEEHRAAANFLFAIVYNATHEEDNYYTNNLGQPACPPEAPDQYTATHWFGGRPVGTAWLATFQNLATALPTPAGGWPLMDGATELLTETDAQAAAEALYINVNTGESAALLPQQNIDTVFTALEIHRCAVEE